MNCLGWGSTRQYKSLQLSYLLSLLVVSPPPVNTACAVHILPGAVRIRGPAAVDWASNSAGNIPAVDVPAGAVAIVVVGPLYTGLW